MSDPIVFATTFRIVELVGGPADGMHFTADSDTAAVVLVVTPSGEVLPDDDDRPPPNTGAVYRYYPTGDLAASGLPTWSLVEVVQLRGSCPT